MPTVRWFQGSALPDRKVRWYNGTATGAAGSPKVRWFNGSAVGNANLTLRPFADVTADALDVVTIHALAGATSPTPSSYAWRQVPNGAPTVTFADLGDTITFTAPPAMVGTSVVFGVTAFLGAQSSPETTATTNVIPHIYWLAGTTTWIALTKPAVA